MDVVSVHTELSGDDKKRVKFYMAAEEPETSMAVKSACIYCVGEWLTIRGGEVVVDLSQRGSEP